jgi:hypothetical protein
MMMDPLGTFLATTFSSMEVEGKKRLEIKKKDDEDKH